jgi:nitroreductase
MDAIECIMTRMSIRKFKPEPVPKKVLEEVISTAMWSPSYKNTQPWEVIVVSGKKKDELSEMLVGLIEGNEPITPDIPEPKKWPEVQQTRINELFDLRCKQFGIDLSDPAVVKNAKIANSRFYGAPHGIFLLQESSLTAWSIFDIGLFAQSLMLAAHAKGLGTVPQAFLIDYAKQIKSFLQIPETKRLVLGISIGYPDMNAPINQFRTPRASISEIVRWIE